MNTSGIPTRVEVEDLKASWRGDPIWDLEETEGFEAYRDELRAHQLEMEAYWRREQRERVQAKADELQINTTLAEYILRLEQRLAKLEQAQS